MKLIWYDSNSNSKFKLKISTFNALLKPSRFFLIRTILVAEKCSSIWVQLEHIGFKKS